MATLDSYGEQLVGLNFGGDPQVVRLNTLFAEIIDIVNEMPEGEADRLRADAITMCLTAQMWTIKAATWGK